MKSMQISGGVFVKLREGIGLTQTETANRLSISRAHLAHIEAGRKQPSVALAHRMAELLKLPLADIFKDVP